MQRLVRYEDGGDESLIDLRAPTGETLKVTDEVRGALRVLAQLCPTKGSGAGAVRVVVNRGLPSYALCVLAVRKLQHPSISKPPEGPRFTGKSGFAPNVGARCSKVGARAVSGRRSAVSTQLAEERG